MAPPLVYVCPIQVTNARKVNYSCVYSAYILKPVLSMLHGIYEYLTLTIYKMYINYASMHPMHLKKGINIPMVSY